MPPEICPNCGAEVPANARVCPGCGSCEETGWSDRAAADRLGLPDPEFDYDEFVKNEFGPTPAPRRGRRWLWWVVACALVAALVLFLLR